MSHQARRGGQVHKGRDGDHGLDHLQPRVQHRRVRSHLRHGGLHTRQERRGRVHQGLHRLFVLCSQK